MAATRAAGPSPLHAVLVGATGAIGQHVLRAVLQDPRFARVTTIGRRSVDLDAAELPPEAGVDTGEVLGFVAVVHGWRQARERGPDGPGARPPRLAHRDSAASGQRGRDRCTAQTSAALLLPH